MTSAAGNSAAFGAISAFGQGPASVISNSVIDGNMVSASSTTGAATAAGAGLVNTDWSSWGRAGHTKRRDSEWTEGVRAGGSIWNGLVFNPPPVQLTLFNTRVEENTVTATPGLTVAGGGLFTQFHVTAANSRMSRTLRTTAPAAEQSKRSRANAVALTRAALSRGSELEKRPAYEVLLTTLWGCSRGG